MNVHVYLLDDEEDNADLPLYFIHGCDNKELMTFDDYAVMAGRARVAQDGVPLCSKNGATT